MKARNRVPNLDHIGRKPGQPRRKQFDEPPPEAFMTPGSRIEDRFDRDRFDDYEDKDEGHRNRRRDFRDKPVD